MSAGHHIAFAAGILFGALLSCAAFVANHLYAEWLRRRRARIIVAAGATLDFLGTIYDCRRLPGQTDDDFRAEIVRRAQRW